MVAAPPAQLPQQQQLLMQSNVPSLVCAFSASVTTGGTIYAFGMYGDALKQNLHLTQLQLDQISATFFIAGLVAWIPGICVDAFGTRISMALGGCSGAVWVLVYWAVARQFWHVVPHDNVVACLSGLAILICLSCGLIIGSIFKLTLLCGGPTTRGSAVGIAKGYVGLGAGVYATIFQALRKEGESALDFLPVIATFFVVCAALPAFVLLPTKAKAAAHLIQVETTPLHFRTLYTSLLVLGTVIVTTSIAEIHNSSQGHAVEILQTRDYGKVALILSIWLGPIASLLYLPRVSTATETTVAIAASVELTDEDMIDSGRTAALTDDEGDTETTPLVVTASSYQGTPPVVQIVQDNDKDKQQQQRPEDLTLPQMLQTPSAWLMLWTTTILVGSGTYKTNNMGQMVESLGLPDVITPAALAIFSCAQAAARLATGVVSEAALHNAKLTGCICMMDRGGVPRPFFLVVASCICFVSHAMLAVATSETMFVAGCTISGVAFGMAWPLMVLIVGDVFGLEHHGANYMFYDGVTKAVGTLVLSEYVAGNVYTAHVQAGELACYGPACFGATHVTVACLALTCVAASFGLQYSSRRAYKVLVKQR